jgi:hypothetical protein
MISNSNGNYLEIEMDDALAPASAGIARKGHIANQMNTGIGVLCNQFLQPPIRAIEKYR